MAKSNLKGKHVFVAMAQADANHPHIQDTFEGVVVSEDANGLRISEIHINAMTGHDKLIPWSAIAFVTVDSDG